MAALVYLAAVALAREVLLRQILDWLCKLSVEVPESFMGKYLQDLMCRVDAENVLQGDAQKQCKLIADLFNLYLPNKIEVGGNIWRFIVFLTADKTLNGKTEVVGLCQDSYVFCDSEKLNGLSDFERKNIFLELFIKGLNLCCSASGFSFEIFSEVENRIIKGGIVFNGFYNERKINPNESISFRGCEGIKHSCV